MHVSTELEHKNTASQGKSLSRQNSSFSPLSNGKKIFKRTRNFSKHENAGRKSSNNFHLKQCHSNMNMSTSSTGLVDDAWNDVYEIMFSCITKFP